MLSAAPLAVLPNISAIRLEIRTRWRRPNVIPGPFLANILRGGLGITLRRLVCPDGWHNNLCHPCPLYTQCAYGQVFEPSPPADAVQLRNQQDLPRPFVIEPPGLHPDDRVTPEGITFRLMLFGRAIEWLPYLISTLNRLGYEGLGRDRVPFTIEQIAALHPTGDEVLLTDGLTHVALPQQRLTTEDLLHAPWPTQPVSSPPNSDLRRRLQAKLGLSDHTVADQPSTPDRPRLQIRFLTPLLLKTGSGLAPDGTRIPAQEVRDRPPFGVILRRLRDRLSSLCQFFGDPWHHPDFASLGHLADTVTLVHSHTQWLTRDRHSTKTGQKHEISGLVGAATYEFPNENTFAALSPYLKLGELLHVGKNAPWGNGGLRCTTLSHPGEHPS